MFLLEFGIWNNVQSNIGRRNRLFKIKTNNRITKTRAVQYVAVVKNTRNATLYSDVNSGRSANNDSVRMITF